MKNNQDFNYDYMAILHRPENAYRVKNLTLLRDHLISLFGHANTDPQVSLDYFPAFNNEVISPLKINSLSNHTNIPLDLLGHALSVVPFDVAPFEEAALNLTPSELWYQYSEKYFISHRNSELWGFIFGNYWSEDIQQAITRLSLVIENKVNNEWLDFNEFEFLEFTPDGELNKFIYRSRKRNYVPCMPDYDS